LYNGKLHDLYWLLNIIRVLQSSGMGQMQHAGQEEIKKFNKKTWSMEITWETQDGWRNNVKMEHMAPSRD
jgi:hypothetical protein